MQVLNSGLAVTGNREPAQVDPEEARHHDAEPEDRDGEAGDTDDADDLIGRAARPTGPHDRERHRWRYGQADHVAGQEQGRPHEGLDQIRYRALEPDGQADVTAEQVQHVARELSPKRLVKPVALPHRGERLRARFLPDQEPRRIAWCELKEEECDQANSEEHADKVYQAAR